MIFGVYVIWQYLEYLEWKDVTGDGTYSIEEFKKIIIGTILFTFAFSVIALLYYGLEKIQNITEPNHVLNYWPVTTVEILILGALIGLIIGFRVFIFKLSPK